MLRTLTHLPKTLALFTAAAALFAGQARAQATDLTWPGGGFATLQAAINGATDVTGDGLVVVQVATGTRSTRVNITRSNFVLRGSGARGTTIQWLTSGTTPVIRVTNATNVKIENLVVRSNNSVNGANGIAITGGAGAIVRDVEVRNATFGIGAMSTTGLVLEDLRVHDCRLDGINLLTCTAAVVRNLRVDHNRENGVLVEGSSDTLVQNVLADVNTTAGIRTVSTTNTTITGNTMTLNLGEGLRLRSDIGAVVNANTITNNAGFGIRLRTTTPDFDGGQVGTQALPGNNTVTGNTAGVVRID
ncbi:MAG: right-handed parallel beta-helix repeat-containing protein [Planctomycetes bacterium]|nr:right-handed parallel beta-helix repeat-containing protein [Planctomycetota bacterium]